MALGWLDYVDSLRLARGGQWRRWLRQPCPGKAGDPRSNLGREGKARRRRLPLSLRDDPLTTPTASPMNRPQWVTINAIPGQGAGCRSSGHSGCLFWKIHR